MRRRLLVFLAAVSVLMLTAPAPQAAVVVRAVAREASLTGYVFRPKLLEVGVGTKVTWKSVAGAHDVTSTSKNWSKSDPLQIGLPTSFTFTAAGTYRYLCTIHSKIVDGRCRGQCGKVVVG